MSTLGRPTTRARRPRAVVPVAVVLVLLLVAAGTCLALPEIVRRVAVARIHALTDRPTSIDRVDLALSSGRVSLTVRGLRVLERRDPRLAGRPPFAELERLDLRVRVLPLLLGRVRVDEAVLASSTVRVVRLEDGEFNLSDLLRREGSPGPPLDLLVEALSVRDGTVSLEDRALPQPRTWVSEHIRIDAQHLSTREGGGSAMASSVTAGSNVALALRDLRLYPIHLQGTITTEGLDATLAAIYLPPQSPVVIPRGRVTTNVAVALDAEKGLSADATWRVEDLAIDASDGRPLAVVPALTARVSALQFREDTLQVKGFEAEGTMNVRDPTARPGAPLRASRVRAQLDDFTWPATGPGRVDVETSIPGGGHLTVAGMLRPPPEPSQLRLQVVDLDLASWAHLLPTAARISGLGRADLRIDEPLAAGVPAHVRGSVAVASVGITDPGQRRLSAARIEASGLELAWPERLDIKRIALESPRIAVTRDREGAIAVVDLAPRPGAPARTSARAPSSRAPSAPRGGAPAAGSLTVSVGEVAVRGGTVAWRDEAVSPVARLDLSSVAGTITGVGWPVRGPLGVRADLRPPGGGTAHLSGRVALEPPGATVRIAARGADLSPYQPYLATPARLAGAADLDLDVAMPAFAEARATVRGTARVARVDVRDAERSVLRVERATASGIDAAWPERIDVHRLALVQPWMLAERDERGALTLRALLTPRPRPASAPAARREEPAASGTTASKAGKPAGSETPATADKPADPEATAARPDEPNEPAAATPDEPRRGPRVSIAQVTIEGGGARIVDRSVSPPFAVDLRSTTAQIDGITTARARPARVELNGEIGATGLLTLHGTVRALGPEPLLLDLAAEIRRVAVPRVNPYVIEHAGWKTTDGWLSTKMQVRVDGDALSSRTDLKVSRLQVARASADDSAKSRIGLPLGMITSLMKDSHGDISVSLPVRGRLTDPRFEVREAIWAAVRRMAVNAIALPVSWIGRVRYSSDSRVEAIEIDPIPFAPGADELGDTGRERVARIASFLEERPEVRMALTGGVSAKDAAALRRPAIDAALDKATRQGQSREQAAARLFAQRFPDRRVPSTTEAILGALSEEMPSGGGELTDLAHRRVAAVQKALKRAGVATDRLPERAAPERAAEERDGRDGQVSLQLLEPEAPRPSKTRELLQRLGVPFRDGREGS